MPRSSGGYPGAQFKRFGSYDNAESFSNSEPVSYGRRNKNYSYRNSGESSNYNNNYRSGSTYRRYNNYTSKLKSPTAGDFSRNTVIYIDGASLNNGRSNARAGIGVFFGSKDSRNTSEPL
ncbi:hypothetical protein BX661DRAFT_172190 [Kickxella alabastrina]|uniref:uncharacterized protein n=1 Tax=Kickxella alabastrina TaxID=61397 RepID=UPI002220E04D|nr:uncharacterized protein BX661DRAFT_172190 [Kickxella alabastrina]KAI7824996.1 hypothetical protein BX661DRAFT_172190 [Kickxella alabastrina]KAJ1935924.1 hypothetical protein GGF37_005809 [Kickxella alabastrina]